MSEDWAPNPASPHGELLLSLRDTDFMQWQHHPITKAFLAYEDDLIIAFREMGADLLEAGAYRANDPHEDRNPDVVRGKLLALKMLRRITLAEIQGFYGKSEPEQSEQAGT